MGWISLFASAGGAVSAQNVAINVQASNTVRIVDERVFGINATMWDEHAGTTRTIDLAKAAGIRTIRIPGGSLSNQYHWRTNTTMANTWSWAAGFHTFTQLITGVGAQAFVSVNYGTGTPEEAAAWVAYANASASLLGSASDVMIGIDAKGYDWKTAGHWSNLRASAPLAQNDGMNFLRLSRSAPIALKYWEIGNENYGSWETDEQAVPRDPYTYGVRTKDYMTKMKAVDPTIKVGVVVVTGETAYTNNTQHPATNPRTGAVRNGWTPVLLATLKSIGTTPDFAIYHRYDQAPFQESDSFLLQSSRTWPNDAADLRQQLNDYLGSEASRVELVVTENNSVYSDPGKQTTSLVNGLFLADSVGSILQTEFNALIWWALRNGPTGNNQSAALYGWRTYGDYGILTRGESRGFYDPHPTYYIMKLLSRFAREGDAVVRATSSNPLVACYAVRRTDGALNLLLINKDPTNVQTVDVTLADHVPAATMTISSYGIAEDEAARTGSGSADVATETTTVTGPSFTAFIWPYRAFVWSFAALPASKSVPETSSVTLEADTWPTTSSAKYAWQFDGVPLPGDSRNYGMQFALVENAGLYTAAPIGGNAADPAILGITIAEKTSGQALQLEPTNIVHPNGNVFDQVLLQGAAGAIKADPGQITRLSFLDRNDDIVQVEFSGAGTLVVRLEEPSGPALPTNYNQSVQYMKGHPVIVVADANETTHLSVFSVGKLTAVNQGLFRSDVSYDGRADVGYIAIHSSNGRFGGLRAGNVLFSATKGTTGVYARGVEFEGPVVVGDIDAAGAATPVLMLGKATDARVAGGDLQQTNGRDLKVSGFRHLRFTANVDSHERDLPAQTNRGRLVQNGLEVTARVVANP